MFRKIFRKNPSDANTVSVSTRSKEIIENLLNGKIDNKGLYLILSEKDANIFENSYGGLGDVFRKIPQYLPIENSFNINNEKKTVEIKSEEALKRIACAYKDGDMYGIEKNANKQVICLAILAGMSKDTKYQFEALTELETLYKNKNFMKKKRHKEIYTLVKEKLALLATKTVTPDKTEETKPVVVISENNVTTVVTETTPEDNKSKEAMSTTNIISDVTNIQSNETTSNVPVTGASNVTVSTITEIEEKKPEEVKPVALLEEKSLSLEFANSVRQCLIKNIDTWEKETSWNVLFFGGMKIEDPTHPGKHLRLADGISKMIDYLRKNKLVANDIADKTIAENMLKSCCISALESFDVNKSSSGRGPHVSQLYAVFASICIKDNKTGNVQVDFNKITVDTIASVNALFNNERSQQLKRLA